MATKIHFVPYVNPEHQDGWSHCGKLIKEPNAYNEDVPGRDEVTCQRCIAHIKKEDATSAILERSIPC